MSQCTDPNNSNGQPFFSMAAVVNWLLRKSHEDDIELSPMKLQKILYFSLGHCLRSTGRPLVDELCSAWRYGPVFPSVYHEYKRYGSSPIPYSEYSKMSDFSHETGLFDEPIAIADTPDSTEAIATLEAAWKKYSHMSGVDLSALTHDPSYKGNPWVTAWEQAKSSGMKGLEISMSDIMHFFDQHRDI